MLEILAGKHSLPLSAEESRRARRALSAHTFGPGHRRWTLHPAMAAAHPDGLAIGLDACRDPLRASGRRAARQHAYPGGQRARATHRAGRALRPGDTADHPLSVGLTAHRPARRRRALAVVCADVVSQGAELEVWLNAGALAEAGFELEAGARRVRWALRSAGFQVEAPEHATLMPCVPVRRPWAHRLAFGRDPWGLLLRGSAPRRVKLAEQPMRRFTCSREVVSCSPFPVGGGPPR